MQNGFFITGTDTNVGKTVLSALLCASLPARYWKPIQTGSIEGTDCRQVREWAALDESQTIPEVYVFDDHVSPHLAARRAGASISLEPIKLPNNPSGTTLIVEGAGGVLVPINDAQSMIDLMRHLALPVIIASRSTLGTINHTLLTLQSLRSAHVEVKGVVAIGPPDAENENAIERYGNVELIGRIPILKEINRESLRSAFQQHFRQSAFAV